MSKVYAFLRDESGATAIEYGIIGALVSVACVVAFDAIGRSLIVIYQAADTSIASTTP